MATKSAQQFRIVIAGPFVPRTEYQLENGTLTVVTRDHVHRRVTPIKQQWSGFWRLCDFLDLWTWLPEYDDNGLSRDGQEWELEIVLSPSKRIKTHGVNAYPSLEDSHVASPTMDRLGLLLHFIDISLMATRVDARDDYSGHTSERN